MADTVGTGHGTTIAWTTASTFVGSYISIGGFSLDRPRLKTSYLGTSNYDTFIAGDLTEVSEVECELFFAFGQILPPITTKAPDTITITIPESTSAGNSATIAGSGFATHFGFPQLITNELMRSTVRFSWAQNATWTAETDA